MQDIKQSLKVKDKYKEIPELNGLNVPCGISFTKKMKYSKLYYIFVVRKKDIKHKEFASSDISFIPHLLDKSIDYLNNELQTNNLQHGCGVEKSNQLR